MQARKNTIQQTPDGGSWQSYGSSGASSSQNHQNGYISDIGKVRALKTFGTSFNLNLFILYSKCLTSSVMFKQ